MKFLGLTLASLGLASAASVAKKVDYDGWKVYRVNVGENKAKVSDVVSNLKLATWKGKVETSPVVDVMVPPSQVEEFEKFTEDLDTTVMHDNLGLSIAEEADFPVYASILSPNPISFEQGANDISAAAAAAPDISWFNAYHTIADHVQWIKDLSAAYPSNTEVIVAGQSNGGRDITGIHIWGSGGKGSQKGVVWHGTVHAREWITTMVRTGTSMFAELFQD